jgi:hypothetical protein
MKNRLPTSESMDYFKKKCLLCDAPLGLGWTHDGQEIWLDLRAPVYHVVYEKSDMIAGNRVVRTTLAFARHTEIICGARAIELSQPRPPLL